MKKYIKTIISGSIFVVLLLTVLITFFSTPVKNVDYGRVAGLNTASGHPSSCEFLDNGKIVFKSWDGEEQVNDYVITDRTIYIIKDNGSLSKIGRVVNGLKIELYLYDYNSDEVVPYDYVHDYQGLIYISAFISIVSVAFLIASLIELKKNNKQETPQEKTEE